MTTWTRRGALGAAASVLAFPAIGARAGRIVRIGYQLYGNLLLLKESRQLEEKLKPLGVEVEWKRFVSGPPLMEALAAGAIDFGTAGETPPIFAQAAGAPLVYLGVEPPAPRGEALVVLDDSPIRDVTGLKGKKVAFNKGSNVHYLFVKAIERAGLSAKDVAPIYLPPAEGRAAFERKAVDAWLAWDPYLAAAQSTGRTRELANGVDLVSNHQFYLGNRKFSDQTVIDTILASIKEIDQRTAKDPGAAAKSLAPSVGLPEVVLSTAVERQTWDIHKMDAAVARQQQEIADTFFKLGLIPKAIRINDAVQI